MSDAAVSLTFAVKQFVLVSLPLLLPFLFQNRLEFRCHVCSKMTNWMSVDQIWKNALGKKATLTAEELFFE